MNLSNIARDAVVGNHRCPAIPVLLRVGLNPLTEVLRLADIEHLLRLRVEDLPVRSRRISVVKPLRPSMRKGNLRDIRERISRDGIDFEVTTSWKRERLSWATGVSLVVPLEVRCETELALVAKLAHRLMLGQTTLAVEFPGYRYGKTDWLREQDLR